MEDHPLAFGTLIRKAWTRTKDRWFSYVITSLLVLFAFIGSLTPLIIPTYLGIWTQHYSKDLGRSIHIPLFIITFLYCFIIFLFFSAILYLLLTNIIIAQTKLTFRQNFEQIKVFIFKYIKFDLCIILLMVALWPADSVSRKFLHIGIFSLLIAYWNIFSIFILLERKEQGFDIFWYGMSLINKQFLHNAFRFLLVCLMSFALIIGIVVFGVIFGGVLQAITPLWFYTFYSIAGFILVIITASILFLFIRAFCYELYQALPKPETVKKPSGKKLIVIIVASWIVAAIVFFSFPEKPQTYLTRKENQNEAHLKTMLSKNHIYPEILQKEADSIIEPGYLTKTVTTECPGEIYRDKNDGRDKNVDFCEQQIKAVYGLNSPIEPVIKRLDNKFEQNGWKRFTDRYTPPNIIISYDKRYEHGSVLFVTPDFGDHPTFQLCEPLCGTVRKYKDKFAHYYELNFRLKIYEDGSTEDEFSCKVFGRYCTTR